MLYGTKLLVIPMDMYELLKMYIVILRPKLMEKHKAEIGRSCIQVFKIIYDGFNFAISAFIPKHSRNLITQPK